MLMFGTVQYIIITVRSQLGAAPVSSGLGLDADKVGLLQLLFSLAVLIFEPIFGLILAKRPSLNTRLLVPGTVIIFALFLLLPFIPFDIITYY